MVGIKHLAERRIRYVKKTKERTVCRGGDEEGSVAQQGELQVGPACAMMEKV